MNYTTAVPPTTTTTTTTTTTATTTSDANGIPNASVISLACSFAITATFLIGTIIVLIQVWRKKMGLPGVMKYLKLVLNASLLISATLGIVSLSLAAKDTADLRGILRTIALSALLVLWVDVILILSLCCFVPEGVEGLPNLLPNRRRCVRGLRPAGSPPDETLTCRGTPPMAPLSFEVSLVIKELARAPPPTYDEAVVQKELGGGVGSSPAGSVCGPPAYWEVPDD